MYDDRMPISFDLEGLRKEYGCVHYFETGLWDPRDDVSSKKALTCGFETVHCIEIRKDWVDLGREMMKEHIDAGKYHLYLDDSANMKSYLTANWFKEKTMFFLDAHVDNDDIHNYKSKCPLFYELEAIDSLERRDQVILIDDVRIIKEAFPWGERSYGNIDFLQQIKRSILSINPHYKFSMLDGHIADDVLLAYV
jgi:hypothetical protein